MPESKGYGIGWLVVLGVIGLLFGIAAYGVFDGTDFTQEQMTKEYNKGYDKAKEDIKPITILENNTVIKYEKATVKEIYLDIAITDFKEWLDNNDNVKCDGKFYSFDEMTIGSIRSYEVTCNDKSCEDYDVRFNIRFNFEDDKDNCSHRYIATLTYEHDDNEPEIKLN